MKGYTLSFGGISEKYSAFKEAAFAVIPYPVDLRLTSMGGTRNGPRAILDASVHMEMFDEETKAETYREGIFTAAEIQQTAGDPQEVIHDVERSVSAALKAGKFPIMLGGEHSGTVGAVAAMKKKFPELTVLMLDAHSDLRDEYQGSKYNDCTVARRLVEMGVKVVQVGVRSMSEEEDRFLRREDDAVKTFYASEVRDSIAEVTKGIIGNLSGKVYVTIDLDVFDPGVMAAVESPEPGGLCWFDVIDILRDVFTKPGREVVGFDAMQLSPIPGLTSNDVLAAKLCYRAMGWVAARKER